jgi:hypothetical protein
MNKTYLVEKIMLKAVLGFKIGFADVACVRESRYIISQPSIEM